MDLKSPFRITNAAVKKAGGPMAHKDIKKIGAIMLPLELAVSHMKMTMKDSMVLNPYANNVVTTSAQNIVKPYEGESCEAIVAAFRRGLKITIATGSGTKRKNEEEDEGRKKAKKGGMDDF